MAKASSIYIYNASIFLQSSYNFPKDIDILQLRYARLALVKGEKVSRADKNLEEITRLTLQLLVNLLMYMQNKLFDECIDKSHIRSLIVATVAIWVVMMSTKFNLNFTVSMNII